MKLKKRIIFTLLYCSDNFVLSRNFRLQNIGDYNWLIKNYNFNNVSFYIDELVILDVSRTYRNIDSFANIIKDISQDIFVPISAGGGIRCIEDAKKLFDSGADKVILNTNLFEEPTLTNEICSVYGKQCLVGSLDVRKKECDYNIYTNSGQKLIGSLKECLANYNIKEIVGELYINSIDKDGTGNGLDLELGRIIYNKTKIPFIIAGGIGRLEHIISALEEDYINAVSTAHLLNFIGNTLEKTRQLSYDKGINLAKWKDIKQLKAKIF